MACKHLQHPWLTTVCMARPPVLLQGFEFYDTFNSVFLSNVTFENYKWVQYKWATTPASYWYWNTPHAFRMISFSDVFKPGERTLGLQQSVDVRGILALCGGPLPVVRF